jgi:hypothetical protein
MKFEELIVSLASDAPEVQAPALEALAVEFQRAAEAAVDALARGPNRFLVAERIHRLGSVCVEPLERLLGTSEDPEARVLAALVLLQLGSHVGVDVLLDAVREQGPDATLAAVWLGKSGVRAVADIVVEQLVSSDFRDVDRDLSYVGLLERMGRALPVEFVERVRSESAPWQLRRLLFKSG